MKRVYTDMTGRQVEINYPPRRIVSLVPSQTELLYDLGLRNEVVGITKFCVHPEEWFRSKVRIGGTKTLHIDQVKELRPDLILANKEENTKEQIEELAEHLPVWISNIRTIEEGLSMIHEVGIITGKEIQSASMIADIRNGFDQILKASKPRKVAYFIWRNPWMCAGGDTFISDIIQDLGWTNVLADHDRYPEINLDQLIEKDPDLILLSSEPYPFKDAHIAEIKAVMPDAEIKLVNGEMFSWYGSRMRLATGYFRELISK